MITHIFVYIESTRAARGRGKAFCVVLASRRQSPYSVSRSQIWADATQAEIRKVRAERRDEPEGRRASETKKGTFGPTLGTRRPSTGISGLSVSLVTSLSRRERVSNHSA